MYIYLGFDIRITPYADLNEIERKIKKWCEDAGDGVSYKFVIVGLFTDYNISLSVTNV